MIIEPRYVKLSTRTGVEVRRSVPHARLRKIGAWCFVDHFGPTEQTDGMVVAAHPHTGLQTVTWLFEGAIDHRDSIGSIQRIEPGQLNLMTAGKGISHSELSLAGPSSLHAIQLWIALPDSVRHQQPFFEHRSELPEIQLGPAKAKLLVGEFGGAKAPTKVFSELVALELAIPAGSRLQVPLRKDFEYGLLAVAGELSAQGELIEQNNLGYYPVGSEQLELVAETDTTAVLLGGVPFSEPLVMWWNFIGRSHDEIVMAREQWNARSERFGEFPDDIGGYIPAPELPNVTLQPR